MAKKRSTNPPPPDASPGAAPTTWVRWLVSLALAWHVAVVFLSPLSVPPASRLVVDLAQSKWVRWYTDQLYLNHGYHFFAPQPPVNRLARWSVVDENGSMVAEGEFPNKEQQSPRLFYHRHMMLADQAGLGAPDVDPDRWRRLQLQGYARHLLRTHGGAEARLEYVRHSVQSPEASQRGEDPNAPETFYPELSIRATSGELAQPLPVPAAPTGAEELPLGGPS